MGLDWIEYDFKIKLIGQGTKSQGSDQIVLPRN